MISVDISSTYSEAPVTQVAFDPATKPDHAPQKGGGLDGKYSSHLSEFAPHRKLVPQRGGGPAFCALDANRYHIWRSRILWSVSKMTIDPIFLSETDITRSLGYRVEAGKQRTECRRTVVSSHRVKEDRHADTITWAS